MLDVPIRTKRTVLMCLFLFTNHKGSSNADVHISLGEFHHYFSHSALDMTLIRYSSHSQTLTYHSAS